MSYITPSPLIYQQLANAGGVLNSTPDLEVCIVGPAYNVVKYVPGSTSSQTKTFSGQYLTGASSENPLPSAKPGQLVEPDSIKLWLNKAVVERFAATGSGNAGDSLVSFSGGTGLSFSFVRVYGPFSGDTDRRSFIVIMPYTRPDLNTGDVITLKNVGPGGSDVITEITNTEYDAENRVFKAYVSYNFDENFAAVADVNKVTTTNVPSTSVSVGDAVVVDFKNSAGDSKQLVSQILAITISQDGTKVIAMRLADALPSSFTGMGQFSFRHTYYDKLLPYDNPIDNGTLKNYSSEGTLTTGTVTTPSVIHLSEGKVISADVHIGYRALRQDLVGSILSFDNVSDLTAQLEDLTDQNPLGLACSLALANTITRVRAISVKSNDLAGYVSALEVSEAERLYALVPLTQDQSILSTFKSHVVQMSTPEQGSWRITLISTPIEGSRFIGNANAIEPSTSGSLITKGSVDNVLQDETASFVADGVVPGDTLVILSATDATVVGSTTVEQVLSNTMLKVTFAGVKTSAEVSYYIKRIYSKTQQAANVKAASSGFGSSRVINIQPDIVGVSVEGVTKYLPGYYLASAVGGMVAGFPVQQGFTNIGVAGITDLRHSNYYFTKAQLNTMAEGGTFLFVQDSQGGIPYCRHELTTDVSVLQYRELLVVKNWDFVSYYFYDKMKPFIGSWNITPDTINTIRQTINASISLLKGKKLPKIGPPLLNGSISKLEQDKYNKDSVNAVIDIELVYPLNYLSIYLVV